MIRQPHIGFATFENKNFDQGGEYQSSRFACFQCCENVFSDLGSGEPGCPASNNMARVGRDADCMRESQIELSHVETVILTDRHRIVASMPAAARPHCIHSAGFRECWRIFDCFLVGGRPSVPEGDETAF